MKILIICSAHAINDDRVYEREAYTYSSLGHDVTIIAPCTPLQRSSIKNNIKTIPLRRKSGLLSRLYNNLVLISEGRKHDFDLVYCHELDSLVAGIFLKYIKKSKLVFDRHEYYPEKQQYKWGGGE